MLFKGTADLVGIRVGQPDPIGLPACLTASFSGIRHSGTGGNDAVRVLRPAPLSTGLQCPNDALPKPLEESYRMREMGGGKAEGRWTIGWAEPRWRLK